MHKPALCPWEAANSPEYNIHYGGRLTKVRVCLTLGCVWLFATPWTAAHQAPPSMGFSRQEYWSGLPFPSPGDLLDPGIQPRSPALQVDSLPLSHQGSPRSTNQATNKAISETQKRWNEFLTSAVKQWTPYSSTVPTIKISAYNFIQWEEENKGHMKTGFQAIWPECRCQAAETAGKATGGGGMAIRIWGIRPLRRGEKKQATQVGGGHAHTPGLCLPS